MQNVLELSLQFGLAFHDLYQREGLLRLDAAFLAELAEHSSTLHARLLAAREDQTTLTVKQRSELIVELAPHLEDFVGKLFGIDAELRELQVRHTELAPLYSVKRKFVQRKLAGRTTEQAQAIDPIAVTAKLQAFINGPVTETSYATNVAQWLEADGEWKAQL